MQQQLPGLDLTADHDVMLAAYQSVPGLSRRLTLAQALQVPPLVVCLRNVAMIRLKKRSRQ